MSDLYKVLGVPKTAPEKRIRAAYRKLALKHHPDRGGDAATFQAVTEAHEVLSDPERRARYDLTGTVDAPKEHAAVAEVMAILSPILFQVIESIAKQGADPKVEHVVNHMRKALEDITKKIEAARREARKTKTCLEAALDRFTHHDGTENLLASATKTHIGHSAARLAQISEEAGRVKKALEYLKTCGYKTDPQIYGYGYTNSATTSGSFGSFYYGTS